MHGSPGDEAGIRFKDPRPRSAGIEWAGLLSANLTHIAKRLKMPLNTIDDLLKMQDRGVKLYMHDASIDSTCPQLFNEFKFPRFFPFDFQRQRPVDFLPNSNCGPDAQHRWSNENGVLGVAHPSIFIGPQARVGVEPRKRTLSPVAPLLTDSDVSCVVGQREYDARRRSDDTVLDGDGVWD